MIAPHIPISGGLSDLLGTDQILRQSNYPQHGDFSPVNILIQKSHVGVIDWEDTKIGYPPLFDFFCLFTPLMNFHNAESISDSLAFFDGMYFSRNRFSRFIREKIMTYCRNFGIDRDLVPLHFFDFLWVKHNRFADKKNYGLATLFLEFMKYFDKNIDRYLVNLFQ